MFNYKAEDFKVYAEQKMTQQHIMGYYHQNGVMLIPDCVRTVQEKLAQNEKTGEIVAFGTAKIDGEIVNLVKPNNCKFWHFDFKDNAEKVK